MCVNVCVQILLRTVYIIQVSPQFYDELTENGTHLRNYNPRLRRKTNKTKQPLQEVKELFPTESSTNSQQCPKSTTRRNPLNFKQNSDQHLVLGAGRTQRKLRSSSAGWCSQEISMYPSTYGPRSKQKPRNYEDESTDDSLTDGENDQRQLNMRCNDELDDRGCPSLSADQKLQLDDGAHLDGGGDDHTVPSASQQDNMRDDHFTDIRLRLSATTQYSEVSNPTQHKHTQCRQREGICEQAKDHPELNPVQVPHSSMHRISTHTCTAQSIHQQDERSICPKELADSATNARGTHNDGGHNTCISYPSMENLSELMKDMSVGDDLAIATNDHSLPVDDRNPCTSEHTMSCDMFLKPDEAIRPPNCTTIVYSASYGRRNLSTADFNPHSASTPCRDQHMQTVDQTFNSISQKSLTATCTARAEVTPGHLEEQEMSILVRETPEHLWCSPNLYSNEKHKAERASERSFRVSESIFQPAGLKSQVCNDSPNPPELPPQHTSCKLSDIDMTTFTNFDNTSGSHTTLGGSHSKSVTEDKSGCLHLTIPPTQDSTHGSEGEWSVLVKQTPDEFWSSPVIRVVNDSLNST